MSRHRMPRARTSVVAPFIPGEDAQDRHQRRLEVDATGNYRFI